MRNVNIVGDRKWERFYFERVLITAGFQMDMIAAEDYEDLRAGDILKQIRQEIKLWSRYIEEDYETWKDSVKERWM